MNIGITESKKSIVIFFKQDITKLFIYVRSLFSNAINKTRQKDFEQKRLGEAVK